MANTNMAVMVNNIIFCATAPTLPSQELLDKLNVTKDDVTIVIDDIHDTIAALNKNGSVLFEYIGELDFFNEVTGLASYCAKHGDYTYDFQKDACKRDYPKYTAILVCPGDSEDAHVDIVIDATDMNIYRVKHR